MPRFAANLSMMFNEVDFLDRFAEARSCGFHAVEYLFPYAYEPGQLAARLQENGLEQVLFNLPPGDWEKGERGMAAIPGREEEFRKTVATALAYARALNCPRLHAMAGTVPAGVAMEKCEATYVANLKYAAAEAAKANIAILLEPLNPTDFKGYFLSSVEQARDIIDKVGADNLRVQYDIYHQQMAHGAIARTLRENFDFIPHIQIAGVPGRHEPSEGQEINFTYLFALIDELGFDGWIGCEYRPRAGTKEGLGWAGAYGVKAG